MGCLSLKWQLSLTAVLILNAVNAWPMRYGAPAVRPLAASLQDEPDYPLYVRSNQGNEDDDVNEWMRHMAAGGRDTDDSTADESQYQPGEMEDEKTAELPSLSLEEMRQLVEMAEAEGEKTRELPLASFSPVAPDSTDNGGHGPFKFVKPTPAPAPVIVQTRSPAPAGPPPMKKHIATISDETPLYLNYAEKEDAAAASQKESETKAGLPKSLVLLPEVNVKPGQPEEAEEGETESNDAFDVDAEAEAVRQVLARARAEGFRPEIDFTQRLAFPDDSGRNVVPAALTAEEQAQEEAEEKTAVEAEAQAETDAATPVAAAEQEQSQEDAVEEKEPTEEAATEAEDESQTSAEEDASSSSTEAEMKPSVLTASEAEPDTPSDPKLANPSATDPQIVHVVGVAAPSHLAQSNDISFIPSPEYGYLLKTFSEKRAMAGTGAGATSGTGSVVTLTIVGGCVGAIVVACVGAALMHRRNSRKQSAFAGDAEEPAYGVTGPGPVKPTFLDLSGDRSLAKSAETYHYQQKKRQILSSTENQPSSGGSTATPRSGDHSDYDSDDDEEEGDEYGDYTVYECPGLAPAGEIEVVNPMFAGTVPAPAPGSNDE